MAVIHREITLDNAADAVWSQIGDPARAHELISFLVCAALLLFATGCMANIRPGTLPEDRPPARAEARGRQILSEMLEAHGGEAWAQTQTLELTAQDEWRGLFGSLANPWPASKVQVALRYKVGTFDSRAEFLDGEDKGLVWGIQSWRTYTERTGPGIVFEDDDDIRFMLPALQYLFELPYRIQKAELVAHAGQETVDGKAYDVVFATWGRLDGHGEHDQFRLFIDPETKRLSKAHYTIRAFASFAEGAVHYDDYRPVDGVLVPFAQYITTGPDDAPEDWVHNVQVSRAQRNSVPDAIFVANQHLPEVGDEKPAMN